jgi:RNA polymerase-associated protein
MAEDILAGGKGATKARKELKEALTASAPIFAASPFFMSEEYTLVDATLAPLLWRLDVLGIELTGAASKQVLTYAATMFKRAGFIKSLTEGEREMRGKK